MKKQNSNDSLIKQITFTWNNINVNLPQKSNSMKSKLPCFKTEIKQKHIVKNG
jgi:hypothetical protein